MNGQRKMWFGTSHVRPRSQCSTWLLSPSSSFYLLAVPSSVMFAELGRGIRHLTYGWAFNVIYSLYFGQSHISEITSDHHKKKLLWSRLTSVWYGNKQLYRRQSGGQICLHQHVGHMETWLFHEVHVGMHSWHLAAEAKLNAQHPSAYRAIANSKWLSIS